jgi:hypothetical protein
MQMAGGDSGVHRNLLGISALIDQTEKQNRSPGADDGI